MRILMTLMNDWYRPSYSKTTLCLKPLAWLFHSCVLLRRNLYRCKLKSAYRFSVPIVVVGNITVGGTGKTPFVTWLAQLLRSEGFHPGIVSRGVGSRCHRTPRFVNRTDAPEEVGDEAILLAQTGCPVVIGVDRVASVATLLRQANCDVVLADDGLQHYRLARDIEIAMIDGDRRYGNRCLLPAGPLREPVTRLNEVDWQIVNGGSGEDVSMRLEPLGFIPLLSRDETVLPIAQFFPKKVHALAGIGHPQRFFTLLQDLGFEIIPHPFPDHYLYQPQDINFKDEYPIIMTEKDAVKCVSFANEHCFYLRVAVKIKDDIKNQLLMRLQALIKGAYASETSNG